VAVVIPCPHCHRRIGIVSLEAVMSMLPAVFDLTGAAPPEGFTLQHSASRSQRAVRHCTYAKVITLEWVQRALWVAQQTGRTRLYPDEVDALR
jgi:hypothetical protein